MRKSLLLACLLSAFTLFAENGLLLVTSEPADAQITCEGHSLGSTPRLITILQTDKTHHLRLTKNGYQPKVVNVRFTNGREPVVINETLVLDSGTLRVVSEPSGAEVILNGFNRGKTPLEITDLEKGISRLKLKLDGYEELSHELRIKAGDKESLYLKLKAIPGELNLSSVPEGARFYVDDVFRGTSGRKPLVLTDLEPKSYSIRAEKDGFEPVTRELTVARGEILREEFRLESNLGRLEVRSSPAGAEVYIDGKFRGTTEVRKGDDEFSAIFPVEELKEGEHLIELKMRQYATATRHFKIQPRKTSKHNMRMKRILEPNYEVILTSGRAHKGVYCDSSNSEQVILEVELGVMRTFPRSTIKDEHPLKVTAE